MPAAGVRHILVFEKFVAVLDARNGQEFALGPLQKEAGVAAETAWGWLNGVVAAGGVYLLSPFCENIGQTLIKKSRLYFTDTEFAAWLRQPPGSQR
ncbi:DUF4143 domain-containing protein [Mesosutterella porci]|uniref:DUF4143 domain-containing protein n=1 Tax=Mesosutterella porci TaxID=2915351 RepID=UPI003F8C63C6